MVDVGALEVGPDEVEPFDVGELDVGADEVGADEVGAEEVGALDVGPDELLAELDGLLDDVDPDEVCGRLDPVEPPDGRVTVPIVDRDGALEAVCRCEALVSARCEAEDEGRASAVGLGAIPEGSPAGSEDPEPLDVEDAGRSLEVAGPNRSEPSGVPASS